MINHLICTPAGCWAMVMNAWLNILCLCWCVENWCFCKLWFVLDLKYLTYYKFSLNYTRMYPYTEAFLSKYATHMLQLCWISKITNKADIIREYCERTLQYHTVTLWDNRIMRFFCFVSLGWESNLKVDERGRIKLLDNYCPACGR